MVRGAVHKKHIKVHFSRIYDLPLRNGFLIKIIILEAHGESKKYLSIINDEQRALSLSTTVHPSRVVRPMLWDLSVVNSPSKWTIAVARKSILCVAWTDFDAGRWMYGGRGKVRPAVSLHLAYTEYQSLQDGENQETD